ncbi:MAG TPA: helix-turn-helix transcriptional regulator [Acetobacteraceae bacterium]|nr:helix-turn-helix transcriptional regulator [Acetobacteraceae bacterium]
MNVALPKPIRESKETITLSRADWEALIELLEDIEDISAVDSRRAHEARVGQAAARRNYLTGDEVRRLLDWESPVKVWREKRGLSQRTLATRAGVSPSYLAEIETGRKPGSAEALLSLGRVLEVPMEYLVSSNRLQIAFNQLVELVGSGASEAEAVAEGHRIIGALKERGVESVDLWELRSRLSSLADEYANNGVVREGDALNAILRDCFRLRAR